MKVVFLISSIILSINISNAQDCKSIVTRKKDNDTFISHEIVNKVSLTKAIIAKDTLYFVQLQAPGNIMTDTPQGVTILLSGGEKLEFPDENIQTERNDNADGYTYSGTIKVSKYDFLRLGLYKIEAYKLYIFENILTDEQGEKLKNFALCLF